RHLLDANDLDHEQAPRKRAAFLLKRATARRVRAAAFVNPFTKAGRAPDRNVSSWGPRWQKRTRQFPREPRGVSRPAAWNGPPVSSVPCRKTLGKHVARVPAREVGGSLGRTRSDDPSFAHHQRGEPAAPGGAPRPPP